MIPDSTTYTTALSVRGTALTIALTENELCRPREGTTPVPCREIFVSDTPVALDATDTKWSSNTKTDANGHARFDLINLAEDAFKIEPTIGLNLTLRFGHAAIPIEVESDQAQRLHDALANASNSRLSRDQARARDELVAKDTIREAQRLLDQSDLDGAARTWNEHSQAFDTIEDISPLEVSKCLTAANNDLTDIEACVKKPEATGDDIAAKLRCLTGFDSMPDMCGPLSLKAARELREARLGLPKVRERIAKADAQNRERIAKAEAEKKALRQRCVGEGVLQVVLALRMGQDLVPSKMRDCKYNVLMGTIQTTTRDGWVIVTWGDSMAAAFKTNKRHADGSLLRTNATATYQGLQSFERTDGGRFTMATFALAE